MSTSRRQFLTSSLGSAFALPQLLNAETEANRFPIALSQYSLRALLKDGSLDALDFPAFTADNFGIKAIDLWEGGLPKDKLDDPSYLSQMKANADKAGTHLFLLMSGALHCATDKRAESVKPIIASVGRAQQLGCTFVRVFLKAPGEDEAAGVTACIESLKPLLDEAAAKDQIIAIEPGASDLSSKGAFLAKVAQGIDHPNFCLMPDFGKLKNNVYDGTEAMLPYTKTVSCKMHSFDPAGNQPDFDYPRLMQMIANSGYQGYLAIEWEGKALEPVAGVKASQALIASSLPAS